MYGNAGFANAVGAREDDDRVTVLLQSVRGCFPALTSDFLRCQQIRNFGATASSQLLSDYFDGWWNTLWSIAEDVATVT